MKTRDILGDFNARLINRMPAEEHIIGKHIFAQEEGDLDILSVGQKDNRNRFYRTNSQQADGKIN